MKMKGRIEEGKNRTKEKKSSVGWRKKMPITNEEGTNRKKRSNIEKKWWYKKEIMKGQIETDIEKKENWVNEKKDAEGTNRMA